MELDWEILHVRMDKSSAFDLRSERRRVRKKIEELERA